MPKTRRHQLAKGNADGLEALSTKLDIYNIKELRRDVAQVLIEKNEYAF